MHEIITLQLGQHANYLATHFWNTQESYFTYSADEESLIDHDIHFRPGVGADGAETFTPRTVIYDLKGGFGSLRKINALYEMEEEKDPMAHGLWNGPTVVQRLAPIEQSAYQQSLEEGSSPPQLTTDTVRYWSDFNRVYFHPRSIVQLNEYELNSSLMPFENWEAGEELFSNLDKEHDLVDRDLRPFVEEADQMQGIQLMASVDDAWGGFAAKYMDRLRDEYGKTTIWVWALEDSLASTTRDKQRLKLANSAKSLSQISPLASLYIPMTIPSASATPSYVKFDRRSVWHVSALLSTAIESITLPSRLKAKNGVRQSLDDIAASLNVNGNQNIAKLRMSVTPTPEAKDAPKAQNPSASGVNGHSDMRLPAHERLNAYASFEEHAKDDGKKDLEVLDIDFFPSEDLNQTRGRSLGRRTHVFGQAEISRATTASSAPAPINEEYDGHERARRRAAGLPVVHRTFTPVGFPLLDSFPNIYEYDNPVSVQTSLSTDTTITARVKSLQSIVAKSIGFDEREALSNGLGEIAEAYEEGYSSGSDEDEDDD